jgi:hypothetical protein
MGGGKRGEMTQTLYAHMNKKNFKKMNAKKRKHLKFIDSSIVMSTGNMDSMISSFSV